MYKHTKKFPDDEKYSLVSQMRRAVVSITSNISEGFGRKTIADKVRFYYIAMGSVAEVQNQLYISRDLGYMSNEVFQKVFTQTESVYKLLNALVSKSKKIENQSF